MRTLFLTATVVLATSLYSYGGLLVPDEDRVTDITIVSKRRRCKTVNAYVSQREYSWRICHDGVDLKIVPFFSNGETWTPHKIVECRTVIQAWNQIVALGLKVTPAQRAEIDALVSVPTMAAAATPIGTIRE